MNYVLTNVPALQTLVNYHVDSGVPSKTPAVPRGAPAALGEDDSWVYIYDKADLATRTKLFKLSADWNNNKIVI